MYHRMNTAARMFVILILLLAPTSVRARPALAFSLLPGMQSTAGASNGGAAWADFDNDGALELVITGEGNGTSGDWPSAILFENTGTALAEYTSGKPNDPAYPGFTAVEQSTVDWADFNGDGSLDVLLAGATGYGGVPPALKTETHVYYNTTYMDGLVEKHFFVDYGVTLPGIYRGRGAWGDYDGDGRADFLLTGYQPGPSNSNTPFTTLYHNDTLTGGKFSDSGLVLPALGDSYAAWGDYNRDGRLDFALMGKDASGLPYTAIYRNEGSGHFTALPVDGQSLGALAWIDVDSDGDLDLMVSGSLSAGTLSLAQLRALTNQSGDQKAAVDPAPIQNPATRLYRNDGGAFNLVSDGLPALLNSSMAFGDYDNDGDTDLLINGQDQGNAHTGLWLNDGTGNFSLASPGVTFDVGYRLSLAWGDFNKDNSLDALVTGTYNENGFYEVSLYINQPANPNHAPQAPAPIAACWAPDASGNPTGGRVVLRWTPPADDSTPLAALTYNVRVGTTTGGTEILNPSADPVTGANRLAAPGNAAYRYSGNGSTGAAAATLTGITGSSALHWAVSAVDASYAGGPFSTERTVMPKGKITAPDSTSTPEETSKTFDVTANDSGVNVTVFAVDPPAHGTASVNGTRQVIYTPEKDFVGTDTVTYYAFDSSGKCNLSTLTVDVTNIPDAPTVAWVNPAGNPQPGPRAIRANQGQAYPLTLVAADPDPNDQLAWSVSTAPAHGTAVVTPGTTITGSPVIVTYTPAANFIGSDTFTVHVHDLTGLSTDLVVQAQVTYTNHLYFTFVRH